MKVIDLLNQIANGEEVPKKIKYKDIIFDYKKEKGDYESEEGQFFLDWVELNEYGLHDEVEIIKEKKIPEKLNLDTDELRGKETPRTIDYLIEGKINEVIDYLKSKGE